MSTFGPAYNAALDGERLKTQLDRVRDHMLSHGDWRTLDEISRATGDPSASVSAQLRHLRKERFGSFRVDKRRRGAESSGLWEYRVRWPEGVEPPPPPPPAKPEKKKERKKRKKKVCQPQKTGHQLFLFGDDAP